MKMWIKNIGYVLSSDCSFNTVKFIVFQSKFSSFSQFSKTFNSDTFDYKALADTDFVFMRWKEHFLVPDHTIKDISGASFAGFYYICFQKSTATIEGYYYHRSSEWWVYWWLVCYYQVMYKKKILIITCFIRPFFIFVQQFNLRHILSLLRTYTARYKIQVISKFGLIWKFMFSAIFLVAIYFTNRFFEKKCCHCFFNKCLLSLGLPHTCFLWFYLSIVNYCFEVTYNIFGWRDHKYPFLTIKWDADEDVDKKTLGMFRAMIKLSIQ